MEAPTENMASLIQDEIIVWLNDVGEKGEAKCFEMTWTGEHGNYTNASAGDQRSRAGSAGQPIQCH
jgi:hypothetical protein